MDQVKFVEGRKTTGKSFVVFSEVIKGEYGAEMG